MPRQRPLGSDVLEIDRGLAMRVGEYTGYDRINKDQGGQESLYGILRLQERIFLGKLLEVRGYTIRVPQMHLKGGSKSEAGRAGRAALEEARIDHTGGCQCKKRSPMRLRTCSADQTKCGKRARASIYMHDKQ